MNFEYYYGTQADQFSFIRIPRILLLDEAFSALSLSAKVLYSVLLDRMGLSMKNKWLPTLEKCEHKNSFINILLNKFRFVFPFILENGQSRLELPTRYTCYLNITFSIEQAFEKRIFPLSKGGFQRKCKPLL